MCADLKRSWTCDACDETFTRKSNGKRHILRRHPSTPGVNLFKPGLPGQPREYAQFTPNDFTKALRQNKKREEDRQDSFRKEFKEDLEILEKMKNLGLYSSPAPSFQPIIVTGKAPWPGWMKEIIAKLAPSPSSTSSVGEGKKDVDAVTGFCLARCPDCDNACIAKLHEYENGDRQPFLQLSCTHNTQGTDAIKMLADGVTEWAEGSVVGMTAAAVAQLPEQARSEVVWMDAADSKFDWLVRALLAGRPVILNDRRYLEQFLSLTRATHAIIGIRAGQAGKTVAHYFFVRLRRQKDIIRQQQAQ